MFVWIDGTEAKLEKKKIAFTDKSPSSGLSAFLQRRPHPSSHVYPLFLTALQTPPQSRGITGGTVLPCVGHLSPPLRHKNGSHSGGVPV